MLTGQQQYDWYHSFAIKHKYDWYAGPAWADMPQSLRSRLRVMSLDEWSSWFSKPSHPPRGHHYIHIYQLKDGPVLGPGGLIPLFLALGKELTKIDGIGQAYTDAVSRQVLRLLTHGVLVSEELENNPMLSNKYIKHELDQSGIQVPIVWKRNQPKLTRKVREWWISE